MCFGKLYEQGIACLCPGLSFQGYLCCTMSSLGRQIQCLSLEQRAHWLTALGDRGSVQSVGQTVFLPIIKDLGSTRSVFLSCVWYNPLFIALWELGLGELAWMLTLWLFLLPWIMKCFVSDPEVHISCQYTWNYANLPCELRVGWKPRSFKAIQLSWIPYLHKQFYFEKN